MTYLQGWPELCIRLLTLIFYSPFCSVSLEGSAVGGALNGLKRLEGFQVSRQGERERESQRRNVNNRSEEEMRERMLGGPEG